MQIERLNINDGGKPTPGYAGSDDVFRELERLVGGSIPVGYVTLMREHNGGGPEIDCFDEQGVSDPDSAFAVDHFYSVDKDDLNSVFNAILRWGKVLGRGMLPIGCDGGDNQIYLNLNVSPATVYIYLHDEDGRRAKVADTLEQFIDGLAVNPDYR